MPLVRFTTCVYMMHFGCAASYDTRRKSPVGVNSKHTVGATSDGTNVRHYSQNPPIVVAICHFEYFQKMFVFEFLR